VIGEGGGSRVKPDCPRAAVRRRVAREMAAAMNTSVADARRYNLRREATDEVNGIPED